MQHENIGWANNSTRCLFVYRRNCIVQPVTNGGDYLICSVFVWQYQCEVQWTLLLVGCRDQEKDHTSGGMTKAKLSKPVRLPKVNVSFSGCGFLGPYHIGSLACFQDHVYRRLKGTVYDSNIFSVILVVRKSYLKIWILFFISLTNIAR